MQLFRFLAVGVLNTLFGYSVFAFALWLGLHYSAALAVATVLGVLFNFQSTGRLVFGCHDPGRLLAFVRVYALIYVLNVATVAILVQLGADAYQAGLLALLPIALISYKLNATYVFKQQKVD